MNAPTVKFGDLLAYPLRSGVTVPKNRRGNGIKMINMGELFRHPRLGDVEMAMVDIDYSDSDRFLVAPGDLLFARRSLTAEGAGRCAIIQSVPEKTTWESSIIRARMDQTKAHPQFYYYLFRSNTGRQLIESIVEQVAVAGVRSTDLSSLRVPNPPLKEQKDIARVLEVLDDKIALNERIAFTSLELAEAQFAHEAMAISGWSEFTLKEVAKWFSGGTPRTSEPSFWGGDIPWISAASLKSPWLRSSDRSVTSLGAENGTRLVPKGSILFVVRGMSLTSEFRIGVAQRELAFGQDCKALVTHPDFDPIVLFLAIKAKTREILQMVDLAGHGTGRLATERLTSLVVRLPERAFSPIVASHLICLTDIAIAAENENSTLGPLRDTLLSQLMSGKLRVRDAERIVEDAV